MIFHFRKQLWDGHDSGTCKSGGSPSCVANPILAGTCPLPSSRNRHVWHLRKRSAKFRIKTPLNWVMRKHSTVHHLNLEQCGSTETLRTAVEPSAQPLRGVRKTTKKVCPIPQLGGSCEVCLTCNIRTARPPGRKKCNKLAPSPAASSGLPKP